MNSNLKTDALPTDRALYDPRDDDLAARIWDAIRVCLSGKRCNHSVATAETAMRFATRLGLDARGAYVAGLAHDLCKEYPLKEQRRLAHRFPGALPESIDWNEKLPHGPAAAVVVSQEFGINDPEILEAIAYHTFGKAEMSDLAIIVYCADKVEPGRTLPAGALARQACETARPLGMMIAVLSDLIEEYSARKAGVAPETAFLYNAMLNKVTSR